MLVSDLLKIITEIESHYLSNRNPTDHAPNGAGVFPPQKFARRHIVFIVTKCYTGPWPWTDSLEPQQSEMGTRFRTWNIWSL
jgi:hypothetical protein